MKVIIYKIINKVKEILKMISIKKVSVTPLPKNNGQIIDSLKTKDNPKTNTLSIRIIKEEFKKIQENINDSSNSINFIIENKQNKILSGTSNPSGGVDGDIYFQYE